MLYSSPRHGLRLTNLSTTLACRVLDMADRARRAWGIRATPRCLQAHLLLIIRTKVEPIGGYMEPRTAPLAGSTNPLRGCHIEQLPSEDPADTVYTDGSWDGQKRCSGAILTTHAELFAIRLPGPASAYKADVFSLALATEVARPGDTNRTDSFSAIEAVKGGDRVTYGSQIRLIQDNLRSKHLAVQYVKAHV